MQRWVNATTLTGKFISKEDVPRKKYLDLAPEAVRKHMPDDPRRTRTMYRIQYLDPALQRQTVDLEAAEFFVPPMEPGADVQIAYLDGNPPRVKGLSRARDAAFLEYFPWGIAVGIFYVIAQSLLRFIPRLFRVAAKAVVPQGGGAVDPDRPELR